jgi:hypothetical protein
MRIKNKVRSVVKSLRVVKKPTPERLAKAPSTQLSKSQLETMLANTYKHNSEGANVGTYLLDPSLSDNRVKVYHDPSTKHTVVGHRGSAAKGDWFENLLYAGGIKAGANFKHSREVQKKAQAKYGTENLTTIGHSKGALHAQEFGQAGDIVTLNKPVNIKDALRYKAPKYQTDYRGEGDVVSLLRPLQRGKKAVTLKKAKGEKKSWNPITNVLTEHGTATLQRD